MQRLSRRVVFPCHGSRLVMHMFPHPRHPSHPGVKSDANNVRHGQTSLQNLPLDDLSKGHTMCFYYFLLFVE